MRYRNKVFILLLTLVLFATTGCNIIVEEIEGPEIDKEINDNKKAEYGQDMVQTEFVFRDGATILERFNPPEGYERISYEEDSFAYFLQNLPLKEYGEKVYYFDGREKSRDVHISVIDIDTGDRDLQQCADAIMRLRGEYLYHMKQYEKIHFDFTNGFKAEYAKWLEGYRISVEGTEVKWFSGADYDNSYETFLKYMDMIFAYAGTLSLSKELDEVGSLEQLKPGDIFIQGGSPGHAVIVVDVAVNADTNDKVFLLAQSYMPAQDMHILQNLTDESLNPWYSINFNKLITPEWTFDNTDCMKFSDN